jgi:hypothetical protein
MSVALRHQSEEREVKKWREGSRDSINMLVALRPREAGEKRKELEDRQTMRRRQRQRQTEFQGFHYSWPLAQKLKPNLGLLAGLVLWPSRCCCCARILATTPESTSLFVTTLELAVGSAPKSTASFAPCPLGTRAMARSRGCAAGSSGSGSDIITVVPFLLHLSPPAYNNPTRRTTSPSSPTSFGALIFGCEHLPIIVANTSSREPRHPFF